MANGIVRWFDEDKGYGFIKRNQGEDVLVHHSDIRGSGYKSLRKGQPVMFKIVPAESGHNWAVDVRPID